MSMVLPEFSRGSFYPGARGIRLQAMPAAVQGGVEMKLARSTAHLQQPPLVLALIAALLRLKARREEQQLKLELKGKS